jgi:hypothetical protein
MPNPAPALLWWVFGFAANDVWAVGQQGAIVHYDGASWQMVASGTDANLSGIWAGDRNEIWAVGGSATAPVRPVLLRWDGRAWAAADPGVAGNGALFKIWGANRAQVYAVGDAGIVTQFDGIRWTQQPRVTSAFLVTVHGRSNLDVWAVGGTGNAAILHFDGTSWSPLQDTGALSPMLGVLADTSGLVVVVGRQGAIAGRVPPVAGWQTVEPPPTLDCLHTVMAYAGGYLAMGGNLLSPAGGLHGVLLRAGSAIPSRLP